MHGCALSVSYLSVKSDKCSIETKENWQMMTKMKDPTCLEMSVPPNDTYLIYIALLKRALICKKKGIAAEIHFYYYKQYNTFSLTLQVFLHCIVLYISVYAGTIHHCHPQLIWTTRISMLLYSMCTTTYSRFIN